MATKIKTASSRSKGLVIGIALFSFIWLLFAVFLPSTQRLNYIWDNFILNLPGKLYSAAFFITEKDRGADYMGNTYSFGKYITKPANPKILICAIDDLTLEEYGWPIPRSYYGDIIEKLNKYGAKGIVFDIIISKSKRDKDADNSRFVAAVAKAGNVANLVTKGTGSEAIIYPIKGLSAASAIMAQPNVDAGLDADGQIRRYMPFWGVFPPLPALLGYEGEKFITYGQTELKTTALGREFPELAIPSIGIAGYAFYSGKHLSQLFYEYRYGKILNYRNFVSWKKHPGWDKDPTFVGLGSFRHISFADILSGRLSKEEKEALKGGIVLIGSTAMGAYDHSPSPFCGQFPGVEVHATFVDNAIAGDFSRPFPSALVALLVLLLPWLPLLLRKYSLALLVSVCCGALLALAGVYVVLLANCLLLPFATISIALLLPFAYITVDKGLAEGREKKWIKNTFGQYLSPKVVDLITKDPSKLSLGGEKRDMTAFFLDLAGFTTMSEKLSPEELTAMLVEYLSAFTDVILKYDGTVDKYIGDCIVAFWNAPLDQADHRKLGVLAAIDCQKEMTRLNESLTQFTIKPKCRVGVNSGPMVVGNMGSRTRLSYTVMGDSVNMASRMEGANKFFASKIMTSEATFGDLKEFFDHRYLGSIRVVGKLIPVKVYEPFARKGEAAPDVQAMLKHYEAGMEKFYAGDYAGSLPAFKAALAARPGDGPSQYYIDTAEQYIKEPPKDWDQSFNLTSKG
ncbi:MAG: adenylate/guanylate cyclase domain-containing protein [Elusimicrobiota bacterium]